MSDRPLVRSPRAVLSLLRLSLAPTLVADLCAGVACARGEALVVVRLLPVSLLLFVGGMALNARVDLEEDRRTRPRRALPSGDVAPGFATFLAVAGLVGAPLLAFALFDGERSGGARTGVAAYAAAMALAIGLYHTPLKRSALLGPLLLGAIRGADLLLGAVAVLGLRGAWSAAWFAALCYALYVAGASFVAHQEDRDARAFAVRTGALLCVAAIVVHALHAFVAESSSSAASTNPENVVRAAAVVAVWHLLSLRGALLLFRPGGFGLIPVETFARLFLSRMALLPAAAALAAGSASLGIASIVAFFAVFVLVRFIPPT